MQGGAARAALGAGGAGLCPVGQIPAVLLQEQVRTRPLARTPWVCLQGLELSCWLWRWTLPSMVPEPFPWVWLCWGFWRAEWEGEAVLAWNEHLQPRGVCHSHATDWSTLRAGNYLGPVTTHQLKRQSLTSQPRKPPYNLSFPDLTLYRSISWKTPFLHRYFLSYWTCRFLSMVIPSIMFSSKFALWVQTINFWCNCWINCWSLKELSENASTEILNQQQPLATANNCQVHPESSSFLLYGSNNIIKKKSCPLYFLPPSYMHISCSKFIFQSWLCANTMLCCKH